MPRKKQQAVVSTNVSPTPPLTSVLPSGGALPDFADVLKKEDLTLADKRRVILEKLGLKKTRRKYASAEERKVAREKRRQERKASRLEILKQYGLEPRKKGPKLTKEERRSRRSARGKTRRSFLREMAKANPDVAKKYGIDPGRFKL